MDSTSDSKGFVHKHAFDRRTGREEEPDNEGGNRRRLPDDAFQVLEAFLSLDIEQALIVTLTKTILCTCALCVKPLGSCRPVCIYFRSEGRLEARPMQPDRHEEAFRTSHQMLLQC